MQSVHQRSPMVDQTFPIKHHIEGDVFDGGPSMSNHVKRAQRQGAMGVVIDLSRYSAVVLPGEEISMRMNVSLTG